ncbi:carbon starvation CstA family protein [Escherichia coli]
MALLPVWLILTARLSGNLPEIGVIISLALGMMVLNPELKMPAMTQYIDGTGPLWKGALFSFCSSPSPVLVRYLASTR